MDFFYFMIGKKTGIYKITNSQGAIYIGQSRDISKRFTSYKGISKKNRGQPKLYNSLMKYGVENHTFEVIEVCEIQEMNIRERYWQDYYDACSRTNLNCTLTSTDLVPAMISEDTRKKLSEAAVIRMKKLTKCPKYMKTMKDAGQKRRGVKLRPKTEAEKKIISENSFRTARRGKDNHMFQNGFKGEKNGMFGRTHSQLTRQKISEKAKGRIVSDEARRKMSEKRSMGLNIKAKIVFNQETGIFYSCIREASQSINHYKYTTLKGKLNGGAPNNTSFIFA